MTDQHGRQRGLSELGCLFWPPSDQESQGTGTVLVSVCIRVDGTEAWVRFGVAIQTCRYSPSARSWLKTAKRAAARWPEATCAPPTTLAARAAVKLVRLRPCWADF